MTPTRLSLACWAALTGFAGLAMAQTAPAPSASAPVPSAVPAPVPAAVPVAAPAAPAEAATPVEHPAPAAAPAPAARPSAPPTARTTPAPAPATSRPGATQQVEVTGTRAGSDPDVEERRRSTASKLVITRDELDKMGDSSLGEVMKRLPGVTVGGPPGRGGNIRMRGMGGGYTQILIDGERVPPGFSLDSIPPEQIERIEVMRSPVAEHGARAIAGTINVVMRADFRRKTNELRLGLSSDGGRPGLNAGVTRNGSTDLFGYTLTLNGFRASGRQDAVTDLEGYDPTGQAIARHAETAGVGWRTGVFGNARLQFKLGEGRSLELTPFINAVQGDGHGRVRVTTTEAQPAFTASESESAWRWQMARLAGNWTSTTESGGKLTVRFGGMHSQSSSTGRSAETGGTAALLADGQRDRYDHSTSREQQLDLSGKFSQLIADRHSASVGWELASSRRTDHRENAIDGVPQLLAFGEDLEARVLRTALYAQDEWDWSKQLSFYIGARWEGIETRGDLAQTSVRNRSSVFTPLAHVVWRFGEGNRDQVRASLTRSYRSPNTGQMIARPSISTYYPDLTQSNTINSPDRAGNAGLKPELAWGLEIGVERYIEGGGVLSSNLFLRRIENLIRNVVALEPTTDWSTAPRWVARPQNIGNALAAGVELEAKGRLRDLVDTELPVTLRANTTLMWSRVDQVPAPRNRIADQPDLVANVGFDWPLKATPVTWGAGLSVTPGYDVRQIDGSLTRTGLRRGMDVYANWRIDAQATLKLSANNLAPRDDVTGTSAVDDLGRASSTTTTTPTFTNVALRLEYRF